MSSGNDFKSSCLSFHQAGMGLGSCFLGTCGVLTLEGRLFLVWAGFFWTEAGFLASLTFDNFLDAALQRWRRDDLGNWFLFVFGLSLRNCIFLRLFLSDAVLAIGQLLLQIVQDTGNFWNLALLTLQVQKQSESMMGVKD